MRVRRAESTDVPWLCDALRAFAADYPAPISLYADQSHAEALVRSLIDQHFVAVADHVRDGTVGLIAGLCQPHPFNPALTVATELWWYVVPQARGSTAGARLFAAFESWAHEKGAGAIAMTLETTSPIRDEALTARGYFPVERQFMRILPYSGLIS